MNQKILIIANWKMNPASPQEAQWLLGMVQNLIPSHTLDKVLELAILKIVNPTALLRLLPNDGSFLLA